MSDFSNAEQLLIDVWEARHLDPNAIANRPIARLQAHCRRGTE